MGVAVEVDFDQIQTMIDVLLGALSDLQAEGATLDSASQLMLAGWDGEAADAYASRHEQWQADQTYTVDELTSAIKALQRALANYRHAEATIIDLVV
ncbi:WXG100 family type VII secretion target [Microbacterium sp. NPDC089320]|uniref:WXG100 family type VII secretion target n=1 Tax=Microbacterium sp. NPDC089320 TaxID=3155182 RepID=UPI001439ACFF